MKPAKGSWRVVITLFVVFAILGLALYLLLMAGRAEARRLTCEASLKQLGTMLSLYTDDWNGGFPPPRRWNDLVCKYPNGNRFTDYCPNAEREGPSYAMNSGLVGVVRNKIKDPGKTVALFESVVGENLVGGPELLPDPPRHRGRNNICFVDGHFESLTLAESRKLIWQPKMKNAIGPSPSIDHKP